MVKKCDKIAFCASYGKDKKNTFQEGKVDPNGKRYGIDVLDKGSSMEVVIDGEVDIMAAQELEKVRQEVCASGKHIVVDLRQVSFWDAGSIKFLTRIYRKASSMRIVAHENSAISKIFGLVKLDLLLPVEYVSRN